MRRLYNRRLSTRVDPPYTKKAGKEGEVDRVYRLLKESLIQCRLSPGSSLSEAKLAKECETSRTPIREACNRLGQDGWIQRIPHRGYIVTPVSVRDLLHTYEYRKLLECFTAEKAAMIGATDQIEHLATIIEVEQQPGTSTTLIIAASDLFHIAIAEIAGNRRILDQLRLTLEYVHRLDILSMQKDRAWIPHADILSAIRARRPSEARQAMATHIDSARERMLKLFAT